MAVARVWKGSPDPALALLPNRYPASQEQSNPESRIVFNEMPDPEITLPGPVWHAISA